MSPALRMGGFGGEFLWELEIVERQLLAMAKTARADQYGWRPDEKVRSVSEVLVHVAAGNFMLLDVVGVPAPVDVYGQIAAGGFERFVELIRKNDELEKSVREKEAVIGLLQRSFQAVGKSFAKGRRRGARPAPVFLWRDDQRSTRVPSDVGAFARAYGPDDRVLEVQRDRAALARLETGQAGAGLDPRLRRGHPPRLHREGRRPLRNGVYL